MVIVYLSVDGNFKNINLVYILFIWSVNKICENRFIYAKIGLYMKLAIFI